jgi:hypothetical protein
MDVLMFVILSHVQQVDLRLKRSKIAFRVISGVKR